MKRLIFIPILTVILAAMCLTSTLVIQNDTKTMDQTIHLAEQAMQSDDLKLANQYAAELSEQWEKSRHRLEAFVNTEIIYEIGSSVADIKSLTLPEQKDEFLMACGECHDLLRNMKESEALSWEMFL